MKVLFVSYELPFWPGGGGGHARHYFLLRELARRHQIDVVAFEGQVRPEDVEVLRATCHRALTIPWDPAFALAPQPPAWARSRPFLLTLLDLFDPLPARLRRSALMPRLEAAVRQMGLDYDLCQVQTTEISDLRAPLPRPAVLAVSDVLSEAMSLEVALEPRPRRRLRRRLELLKARRWERRAVNRYDRVICISEQERRRLKRLGVRRPVRAVPPGVDLEHYAPLADAGRDRDVVLLLASYEYAPNVDSARWFVAEVLPALRRLHPGARVRVAGRGADSSLAGLAAAGVEVVGFVPDERTELARAAVAVIPARLGVGVRMKVPIFWATKTAFVSTSVGVDGHPWAVAGVNYLNADSAGALAESTAGLMQDGALRSRLVEAGRRTAEDHYSWVAAAAMVEEEWEAAIRDRRSGR